MDDFSFAYMQEAFVATLLVLARGHESVEHAEDPDDDLERYEFYRVMKRQVAILREDMDSSLAAAQAPTCMEPYASREACPVPRGDMATESGALSLGQVRANDSKFESLAAMKDDVKAYESIGGFRKAELTADNAMIGLSKVEKLNNRVWEWGPR